MPGLRWSPPAIGSRCDGCRTCASGGRRRATSRRFARSSTRRPASRCCGNKPSPSRSTSTSLIPCLVCDRAIGELPLRTAPSGARRTYVRERIDAQDSGSRAATARILSVAQALPPNFADQDTLLAAFRELWGQKHFNLERLEQLHRAVRSEEHTSELQSRSDLVCRLLLEKKKKPTSSSPPLPAPSQLSSLACCRPSSS